MAKETGMSLSQLYPRDLIGYGPNPFQVMWPNGARIAVQFVLNCEEGGENTILRPEYSFTVPAV